VQRGVHPSRRYQEPGGVLQAAVLFGGYLQRGNPGQGRYGIGGQRNRLYPLEFNPDRNFPCLLGVIERQEFKQSGFRSNKCKRRTNMKREIRTFLDAEYRVFEEEDKKYVEGY